MKFLFLPSAQYLVNLDFQNFIQLLQRTIVNVSMISINLHHFLFNTVIPRFWSSIRWGWSTEDRTKNLDKKKHMIYFQFASDLQKKHENKIWVLTILNWWIVLYYMRHFWFFLFCIESNYLNKGDTWSGHILTVDPSKIKAPACPSKTGTLFFEILQDLGTLEEQCNYKFVPSTMFPKEGMVTIYDFLLR